MALRNSFLNTHTKPSFSLVHVLQRMRRTGHGDAAPGAKGCQRHRWRDRPRLALACLDIVRRASLQHFVHKRSFIASVCTCNSLAVLQILRCCLYSSVAPRSPDPWPELETWNWSSSTVPCFGACSGQHILSSLSGRAHSRNVYGASLGVLGRMFLFRCCRPAKPSTPVDEDKLAEDPSPRPVLAANKSFETIRANTRSDSRILQTIDSTAGRNNAPSRSLLEASARRLVTQETTDAPELDKDDHGIPNKFMTAYFNALKSGNSRCGGWEDRVMWWCLGTPRWSTLPHFVV